ncbi:multidrug resistance efflux pump [Terriglobus roseus DSM 18391]|uniref:Multidrug resistance efflux pump n=1 Tax=Terriglobus roseus (strain DSM 18391 / NRRL B-41598 / KBS 63) TaxID=926566 RepID=I3ZGE6_TERRK|nr:HlyD family efflux transporter periplasmic adaptor subunit [Terriglobus roseus]AFL88314.1 multidrug resistance efflux pump [Terriglobus roseus DSM 18391]
MDIVRPDLKRKKFRRNVITASVVAILVAVAVLFLLRLKPASPTVEGPVFTDVVKRGPMLRQVRGPGTLTPREDRIRLIPAESEATVVRIRVLPGAVVHADTILMDLIDPATQQQLMDAQLQVQAAKADLKNTEAKLQSDLMTQRAAAATVRQDQHQANLQAQTDKNLLDLGVISGLKYNESRGKADELNTRNDIEGQRLQLNQQAVKTQIAVQQAKVEQAQAMLALKQRQTDALSVRAGIDGVLVDLPHQVGEHVDVGTTLAKVVQPDQLKASLKIAETQARDIQIGQPAAIDTHNGIIAGQVTRVDPAVQNGTVTVDVALTGSLPQGARPDLSVDGTIDLDRLNDVIYVGRPAQGNENSTLSLFKVLPDGRTAVRTSVQVGRASVNAIQVLGGLQPGDTVVLSDMSKWDNNDRVQIEKQ